MSAGRSVAGRYRLVERLGLGGMGEVYRAIDESSGRAVALKRLVLGTGHDAEAQSLRFRREFHTMAGLRHRSIVEVFDYGLDDAGPFYTMELLDGADLRTLGKTSARDACRLLREVASALAYLHVRRLIHRDVAARNVRETSDGRAKLFDFGVLATPGLTSDVAGTPPHVAPENLWRLPLDARADLFGLGALAYWMLTGSHAYPARTLAELPEAWRRRPVPPSALEPSIPEALDALVMSLLSLDPLGRPATAAEVIDRLTAAGGLERDAGVEAARGWVSSTTLVGRTREMEQLERRLRRTLDGRGRAVLVEAPSGTGKSRLLRELGLTAQVAGATVAQVTADPTERGPYGLVREVARALREAAPEEVAAAVVGREETLARLAPEALARASRPAGTFEPTDPAAERLRAQRDLSGFLLEVAARKPLVLLVDDVQRADEASAAVLAAVAWELRGKRLLLATSLRTDEPVRAEAAVAALREASAILTLRGLSARDLESLVVATFGRTTHAERLAAFLHAAAGGHPLRTSELLRHLVERAIVRYEDGAWSIPDALPAEGLPQDLVQALDARVAALPPAVRALGQALAVLGGEVSLATAVALADARDEDAVFSALDRLVGEDFLAGSAGVHHLRHDGLREALLRSLDPTRRAELHLRAARALLREGNAEREAETGWHLHHGGEQAQGAELLERAGRRLFVAQSFADAIRPLEAALAVIETRGAPPRHTLDLRRMLIVCGTMADRDVVLRHAPVAIEELRLHAGTPVAERLAGVLGRHLGLVAGLAYATVRAWLRPARRAGPRPLEALALLFAAAAYAASAWSLSFEPARILALLDGLRPLAVFRTRIPYAAYLLVENFHALTRGGWRRIVEVAGEALGILENDTLTPMPPVDKRNGRGAALYMAASARVVNQDPAYARELRELEALGLRFFDASTVMARLYWHRFRGEEELALQLEAEAERRSLQLGPVWVLQSQSLWMSSLAYGFTRDVPGLKRCIEAMARLCERGYRFEPFVLIARGDYHRERGELDEAERALREALAVLPADDGFRRLAALSALAETLVAAGQPAAAIEIAEGGLRLASDAELGMPPYRARLARALALGEASRGDHEAAERRLAEAREAHLAGQSPSLLGAIAEARARVALLALDLAAFEVHRAETERWFRPTRNPVLVARADRLDDLRVKASEGGKAARTLAADAVTARAALPALTWIAATLRACPDREARARRALQLLCTAASAEEGWLFGVEDGELLPIAATHAGALEPEVVVQLARLAAAATESELTQDELVTSSSHCRWVPVILTVKRDGRTRVVAAAALFGKRLPLAAPDSRDVGEIARQLDHDVDDRDDDDPTR